MVDNNFNTLWSVFGKGSWIQLDLGSSKNICSVNIAWYKGDARQNNFVISTSTDGSTYNTVLTSKSAGNTLSYEKYQIPTALARYVKITVNGNTQNNYASITEVKAQTNHQVNNNKLNVPLQQSRVLKRLQVKQVILHHMS